MRAPLRALEYCPLKRRRAGRGYFDGTYKDALPRNQFQAKLRHNLDNCASPARALAPRATALGATAADMHNCTYPRAVGRTTPRRAALRANAGARDQELRRQVLDWQASEAHAVDLLAQREYATCMPVPFVAVSTSPTASPPGGAAIPESDGCR